MFKDIFQAIASAVRKLFSNFGTTLIALVLYGLLWLVSGIFFFATTERSATHVILSLLVLPLTAVILFFVWQALGVSYVRIGVGPGYLLRRALGDSWKLLLVSLPMLLLIWLVIYLGKYEPEYLDAKWTESDWPYKRALLLRGFRLLLGCAVIPLGLMHLWIAAVREGVGGTYRGFLRNLGRALAPRAVAIYALLFAVFGALIYLLLFTRTSVGGAWVELGLLGGRLTLAALLAFAGWFVTLGALAEVTAPKVDDEPR